MPETSQNRADADRNDKQATLKRVRRSLNNATAAAAAAAAAASCPITARPATQATDWKQDLLEQCAAMFFRLSTLRHERDNNLSSCCVCACSFRRPADRQD